MRFAQRVPASPGRDMLFYRQRRKQSRYVGLGLIGVGSRRLRVPIRPEMLTSAACSEKTKAPFPGPSTVGAAGIEPATPRV